VNDYRGLYQTLQPRLQELDARRVRIRNAIIGGIVSVLLGIQSCSLAFEPPGFVAAHPAARFAPPAFLALMLFCFGLAFVRFLIPGVTGYLNYRAHFKKDVVASLVRAVQPGARYFPDRHLKREVYDQSRLFRMQLDKFRGDDLLQGSVGDTPFECSELDASYTTGSGKNSTTHRVFTGLFFRIDFDRDCAGHTVVKSVEAKGADRAGMEAVELGDAAFEEAFTAWSTQPDAARALLTPELRERLVALDNRVAASLHFAFAGRTVYAAADYGKQLFEPGIVSALKESELRALAAPFALADDLVRALGLETRRRPADAAFHTGGFKVDGMEALAQRITSGGDVGLAEVAEAAAAESDSGPIVPPMNPYPRVTDTGMSLEVRYPATLATLFVLVIGALLTPLLAASVWNLAAGPDFAAQLRPLLAERWPGGSALGEAWIEHPTGFLAGSLFLWWMFAGTLLSRPTLVTIDSAGVAIRRLLLPWSLTLPLDVIRRVDARNRSITFVRSDRGLLRSMVMASPNLRDDMEARWLAAQLRQALKRSGWRPVG
jgi:hypothetical protein